MPCFDCQLGPRWLNITAARRDSRSRGMSNNFVPNIFCSELWPCNASSIRGVPLSAPSTTWQETLCIPSPPRRPHDPASSNLPSRTLIVENSSKRQLRPMLKVQAVVGGNHRGGGGNCSSRLRRAERWDPWLAETACHLQAKPPS